MDSPYVKVALLGIFHLMKRFLGTRNASGRPPKDLARAGVLTDWPNQLSWA